MPVRTPLLAMLLRPITSGAMGGRMARQLLPGAIALPLLITVLISLGQSAHAFNPAVGDALLTLSMMLFAVAIIWQNARTLNQIDHHREQLEDSLQQANENLDAQFADRTIALRESEARLQAIIDNASAVISLKDLDGRYLLANRQFESLFYTPKETICGKTDHEYFPAAIADSLAANDRRVLEAGEAMRFDELFFQDDGIHTYLSIKFPVRDGDNRIYGVCSISTDISDRQRIETALRESEQRFQAFMNHSPTVAFIKDETGRYVYMNHQGEKVSSSSSVQGKTDFDLMPADIARSLQQNDQQVLSTGRILEVVESTPNQNGVLRDWLTLKFPMREASGRRLLGGVALDVTERRLIEAALQESDRRWRYLLDNVQLLVVGLDQVGTIEYVNPFFLTLTGYAAAEIIGQNWFTTFLPKHQQILSHQLFQEILQQEQHPYYQQSLLTQSSEERLIAWNNTCLRNAQGEAIGIVSIGEDITQRAVLERMKSEFVSVVSHELRTPLTSMQGALSLLECGAVEPNSEWGQKTIAIAVKGVDRLVRLVDDILDLERLESGKISLHYKPCDVAKLLSQAAEQMQMMANHAGITLEVTAPPLQIMADGDRILQVLTNLLSNAIKFSPAGSTVWLSVTDTPALCFTIKDQGRGIPAEDLETIFDRFHQVDASDARQKEGTGLGLAICRSIVEQHGGQLWVKSTLGKGSEFQFTLSVRNDEK
jgi:PAS domain S-box-containing protein